MATHVKICGITRPEDGVAACQHGASAIGLVFYEPSPRAVTIEQARAIVAALPPFVSVVGLFVNAGAERVNEVLRQVSLDLLQFHGDESPEYCGSFGRRYFKAIRMRADIDLSLECARYTDATAILLDTYQKGVPGGTGETFEWQRVPKGLPKPVILAGGLDAENVAEAIHLVSPYAVDVSGGVEADKGVKDSNKIAALMQAVKSTN